MIEGSWEGDFVSPVFLSALPLSAKTPFPSLLNSSIALRLSSPFSVLQAHGDLKMLNDEKV